MHLNSPSCNFLNYFPDCDTHTHTHTHTTLYVCVVCVSCSILSGSLQPHGLQPTRFFCPWNSPGKNNGVAWHTLLQGIFLTKGSNPGLPHCRQILYHLRPQGNPLHCTLVCPILCNPMHCRPPGSSIHGFFPGKNTVVGCHFLFQGIS